MRRLPVLLVVAVTVAFVGLGALPAVPATAGVCQTCDDPPPPPPSPHPPSPPPPCYQVVFLRTTAYAHEDSGGDDLSLKFNGGTVWTYDYSSISKVTQKIEVSRFFRGGALVEMWDRDWPDPDDWLGTVGLDHTMMSPNGTSHWVLWVEREMVFDRDGAHHRVAYEMGVVPDHYCG